MVVKDVLRSAIVFVNKSELLGLNSFDSASETAPTVSQQADIDLFVQCFNYVYKEIASSYFPLLEKQKVVFTDNKFYYKDLAKQIVFVKKISKSGQKLKYYQYPQYIECETDSAEIVYAYLPNDFSLTDEVNLFGGKVLGQVMAYGVAREYCLIMGNYSDADIWEARFKNSLESIASKKRSVVIAKRRFF